MKSASRHSEIMTTLQQARLFGRFSEDLLCRLLGLSELTYFEKETQIIAEGIENRNFYVLISGSVTIVSGQEYINSLGRKGDLFGELSSITQCPAAASIRSSSPVEALMVPAGRIFESEDFELKSMVYQIAVDILSDKLKLSRLRVQGFQAASSELSEKKHRLALSESTLKQKDSILQSVLSSMSEGVVVTAGDGNVLHANPAFCSIVGGVQLPDKLFEWPARLGIFKTDCKTLLEPAELLAIITPKDENPTTVELFVCNDRLEQGVWLQANSQSLKTDALLPDGYVIVFHDISKKIAENLALQKAKKEAEETARVKSNFLSVVSHELRTPLNSILGTTDLLSETTLNEEQLDHLNSIKASSEILFTTIRNILDYNALESDSFCEEHQPFSIVSCFQEIKNAYQAVAAKKNIQLKMVVDKSVPEKIIGCQRAVKQVLRNLVDNAIKFTSEGTVELIAQIARNPGRNAVIFTVKDTGIGIAEKDIPSLFRPFSQVDSSNTRRFDGTGIGLSICQRIVGLIGGTLSVRSQTAVGTEFEFLVEFAEANTDALQSMESHTSRMSEKVVLNQSFAVRFPMNILIAEDNPLNQKLIEKMLKKLGYEPTITQDGNEAMEAVRKQTYQLLLMDLQMPKVDGLEATERIINEIPKERQPVIIALTAAVSNEIKDKCLKVGMQGFITKPLSILKLSEILQQYYLA